MQRNCCPNYSILHQGRNKLEAEEFTVVVCCRKPQIFVPVPLKCERICVGRELERAYANNFSLIVFCEVVFQVVKRFSFSPYRLLFFFLLNESRQKLTLRKSHKHFFSR